MRPRELTMRGFRSYRDEATFDFRGRHLVQQNLNLGQVYRQEILKVGRGKDRLFEIRSAQGCSFFGEEEGQPGDGTRQPLKSNAFLLS